MKKAHFSIDDVGASFRYISDREPESIFDLRLYSQLKRWHQEYGLVSNLYCIFCIGDYCISNLPDKYRLEFRENSDWLKFGFHSWNDSPFIEDSDYKRSFTETYLFFNNMKMGKTSAIRLHSWKATDEQEEYLFKQGIDTVFMPNDKLYNYDEEGTYMKNNIIHRRTDVWFEKTDGIMEKELKIEKGYLTLFTHEWCFDAQKEKIEKAIKLLDANGFNFI